MPDGIIDNRSKNIFWFMKPLPAYYPSNVYIIPNGDAVVNYFSCINAVTYHVYFIYDATNHTVTNLRGDTSEQIGVSVTSDNRIVISQAFSYSELNYKALDINSDNTVNIAL